MVLGEALGRGDHVEDPDADRLLFGRGHQHRADLLHALERPAERAARRYVPARQGDRRVRPVHLHHVHLRGVHAEVVEHPEQLVVGHIADGGRDLLAFQLGRVGLGDAGVAVDHAVVGLGIAHRHPDELERKPVGDGDHPGHQPLGVGDVDVARGHRLAHLVAVAEGAPFHLDAQGLVVGLLELRDLVRGRPLEEVGHRDLVEGGCGGHEQGRRPRGHDGHEARAMHVDCSCVDWMGMPGSSFPHRRRRVHPSGA